MVYIYQGIDVEKAVSKRDAVGLHSRGDSGIFRLQH